MPTKEYLESLSKQYETLNKLILEAENSKDREKSIKLYYKARSDTEVLSNSLHESLENHEEKQKLNAA